MRFHIGEKAKDDEGEPMDTSDTAFFIGATMRAISDFRGHWQELDTLLHEKEREICVCIVYTLLAKVKG